MNDDQVNTYYLYDGANVVADTDGTGVIKSYYLRGPSGNLISTETEGKFYYYATDGLGSTTGITDETGAIISKYQYDEFGNISFEQSNIRNPFKFTGAIHDKTANLYLMGSRYYNPKVGRFITQDSFGATFGADWTEHLYSYTGNNPVNFIDPTGHFTEGATLKLGSTGQDVEMLQRRLVATNYLVMPKGVKYGYFGQLTLDAVNRFKNDEKLWNTGEYRGIVGETTWRSLGLPVNAKSVKVKSRGVKQYSEPIGPPVAPPPPPKKTVKTIEQAVKEVDLSNVPSDIWTGMTCEGWKPYKQTGGAVMIGVGTIVTAGQLSTVATGGMAVGTIGTIGADYVGAPPTSTFAGGLFSGGGKLVSGEDLWYRD